MRRAAFPVIFATVIAAASPALAGDNSGTAGQDGESRSGDAVGGGAAGIVREGNLRAVITNHSGPGAEEFTVEEFPKPDIRIRNVQDGPVAVASGDSAGSNDQSLFVGLVVELEDLGGNLSL